MATTNDLKNGTTLNLEGQLRNVVEFQHVKPGEGPAFVRTRPAMLETGATIQVPPFITAGEKVKVDTRSGAYLGRA